MTYTLNWLVENRVIELTVEGELLLLEIPLLADDLRRLMEVGQQPVHTFVDVTRMTSFPTSISELNRVTPRRDKSQPHWTVVVGGNHFVQLIANVLLSLAGAQFRTFRTRQAALGFLAEQDATLVEGLALSR